MSNYLFYTLLALVAFNIYVNIKLVLSPLFERFQKIVQSIIIWVLPFFVAAFVLYIVNDNDRDPPPPPSKNKNYANDSIGVQYQKCYITNHLWISAKSEGWALCIKSAAPLNSAVINLKPVNTRVRIRSCYLF